MSIHASIVRFLFGSTVMYLLVWLPVWAEQEAKREYMYSIYSMPMWCLWYLIVALNVFGLAHFLSFLEAYYYKAKAKNV